MQVEAIKTRRINAGDSLEEILDTYVPSLKEKDIIAITSKIVSVCQGRVVPRNEANIEDLIKREADAIIGPIHRPHHDLYLTMKDDVLVTSAGIDESNGDDVYILYPQNVQDVARSLWAYLRAKHKIHHLGVIITDSNGVPLRPGNVGFALGWCGFEPLYSYIGKPDIYGRLLRVTRISLVDAIAAPAVYAMGEGSEKQPLAIIKEAPKVKFLTRPPTPEEEKSITIPMEKDHYATFLVKAPWKKTH